MRESVTRNASESLPRATIARLLTPTRHGVLTWIMMLLAAVMTGACLPRLATAQTKRPSLPYVTIDHPQFILASQATFMSSTDMLIGVTDGKTAKAYPAAILAQHGVVQDRMADGPIAVTW